MKKRMFSFLLALCMCVALIPAGAASGPDGATLAAESGADADFGWSFDEKSQTLTISGPGSMPDYTDGAPWNKYRSSIAYLVIQDGVTSVADWAFWKYDALTSVTFSGDVGSIGYDAFYDCDALTSVTFPGDVGSIGDSAFGNCDALTSVTFPGDVGDIGDSAFGNCDALTSVTFSGDVGDIGDGAFDDCDALTSVTFSGDVGSIGEYAFADCDALTSVTFSGDVGDISFRAFWNCYALTSVTFPGDVGDIGEEAFYDCYALTSVTFSGDVGSIGGSAFYGCDALTSVTFSGDVGDIGYKAFCDCDALTSVTFSGDVGDIGSWAFYDCDALTSVTFSGDVGDIGNNAFILCKRLTDIYYSGTREQWEKIAAIAGIPDTCTVHYNSGGGDEIPITIEVKPPEGGAVTVSADKAKPGEEVTVTCRPAFGYGLTGLTVNGNAVFSGSTSEAMEFSVVVTNGDAFYIAADFQPIPDEPETRTYTVTFDANGGSVDPASPTSKTVTQNGRYGDLPMAYWPSHSFLGWFTAVDGGTQITAYSTVSLSGPQTLYAHWHYNPPTYTVKFDANGGTVSPTSTTVTQGATYGSLPTPTRANYKFDGWFTSANGGTQVQSGTTVNLSAAQTLYAHWMPVSTVPGLAAFTYSFGNSASGLGYPKPYQIPYERYVTIFGDTMSAKWYFMASGDWGGNCYGFSSTAAMFSQSGNGVDTGAFRSGATLPSQLQTGDKNASWNLTARDFLECMQVSQNAPLIQKDYANNKNKLNELCAAVKAYQQTGENPVMVAVFGKQGGHALLAYKIEQEKLYVYDCNYPNTERYITLTTDASGNYVGWYYHLNDVYDWGSAYKGSWISFVPYADFLSVWENRKEKNLKMELLTVNADVELKNDKGVPIASLEGDELSTMQPDIYPFVEIGITADGEAPKRDKVSFWIPVGIYDLNRTGDYVRAQGELVLMGGDNLFEVRVTHVDQSADVHTTAEKMAFVVNDTEALNRVMLYGGSGEGSYDVTFQSTLPGNEGTAQIKGSTSTQALTFGMASGHAVASMQSMASIEEYFLNGHEAGTEQVSGDTTTLVTFSAHGGSGSMAPRKVAGDGKFTLPECEFTAPSRDGQFTGWMVNGVLYQTGKTVELDADAEAIAQWSGYGIDDVTTSGGKVTVKLLNPVSASVTVAVCAYADGGKLLASAVKAVDSGASAELTLQTSGAAYLRAFILDTQTNAPLCNPLQKKL